MSALAHGSVVNRRYFNEAKLFKMTLIGYYIVGFLAHHRAGVGVHQWDMTLRVFEELVFVSVYTAADNFGTDL